MQTLTIVIPDGDLDELNIKGSPLGMTPSELVSQIINDWLTGDVSCLPISENPIFAGVERRLCKLEQQQAGPNAADQRIEAAHAVTADLASKVNTLTRLVEAMQVGVASDHSALFALERKIERFMTMLRRFEG